MNRGMTVRDGIRVCGGMTVKQFIIPQRDLLLAPRRYNGSRRNDGSWRHDG
ncbi:hypothetical protein [Wolbachia endosymbiont of Aedes albopictus]|uniref:hypothetical protein n=1 Tax=Wolbachia endosymbiont of Aedes albopictus TaxID=167957 RepID=UPI002168C27F|nr:hypothetical protein [Wolbachia endosymbiont of Aedes albopictus]UVW84192.1 hypothetical protein NHG98_01605 [Wolbachia endosymbiont of Aedes albopictus]